MTDKTKLRFVCVGKAELKGGGIGSLVLPEDQLEPFETHFQRSTVFKVALTVGVIYEGECGIDEEGCIRNIPKKPDYVGKAPGDWAAAMLEEKRLDRKRRMESLAKRAQADRFAFAEVRNLGAIVAKMPMRHRMAACQTLAGLIFDESMKGRR